jgi:hypothetical protein
MSSLTRAALRQCLVEKSVSVRQAARLMGVSKATVERYVRTGFEIPPLRSSKLAWCFVTNLVLLVAIREGRPR